jgi:dCMP deaminase
MNKWDEIFLDTAKLWSRMSKDPSTKVGACIANGKKLLSVGYNGFSSPIEDKEEWYLDRETKYSLTVHAEINAILSCREPQLLKGATLYVYPLYPCASCSSIIANSGITRVVTLEGPTSSPSWEKFREQALFCFSKANIEMIYVKQ